LEGRGQQLGIATLWILSQALSPANENKYALGSLKGYIVSPLLGAKTEIPDYLVISGHRGGVLGLELEACTYRKVDESAHIRRLCTARGGMQ
jgi:hypothetical protein